MLGLFDLKRGSIDFALGLMDTDFSLSTSAVVYALMVVPYPGANIKVGHMASRQISVSLFS